MARRVGFIGLGIMGFPMAKRLIEAGHQLTVYNRTASKAEPLVKMGAKVAATPAECAKGAEFVISIVTDGPDVEAVLLGKDGALSGAKAPTLFIDMSTIAPDAARRISLALGDKGISFLDAPVTGGDVGAREGTLSILVGGEKEDLEKARELFNALGKKITHCGAQGAGQTVKACNQILCALNMLGLSEALHLANRSGIEPKLVVDALSSGAGGSWALEKLGPRIAQGDFDPGFMVDLIQKDLRIVQAAAERIGLPIKGVNVAQGYFADNQKNGEGSLGTQALFKALGRLLPPED